MGESRAEQIHEVSAIAGALKLGYRLLDTAEMYGHGGAERVIGGALRAFGRDRRSELCIVSKVMPENASRRGTVRACEASIERMGCEYLDLYLLHWRSSYPFSETLRGFNDLLQRGLIRHFGVSNFDVDELSQWLVAESQLQLAGSVCCNQIYYCLEARAVELELLPWQRAHGIQTMAYSPLGRGALAQHPVLEQIGRARGASAAQIALAWCVREVDVVAIPKSSDPERIEENWRSAQLHLSVEELAQIDRAFAPV